MAYAVGYIVYGIDLTLSSYKDNGELGNYADNFDTLIDASLINTAYSGNGDAPIWLGVELRVIDECNNVRNINFAPTETQIEEYNIRLQKVLEDADTSREFAEYLRAQTPETMILWGSS